MENGPGRKLFTPGEMLTLAGVVLSVMSAANTWSIVPAKIGSTAAATYVAAYQRSAYPTSAYGLSLGGINVGWIVVLAALAVGSLLLFNAGPIQRSRFFAGQFAAGLLILGLAIRYLSLHAGTLMAMAGGIALMAGAVLRYRPEPHAP